MAASMTLLPIGKVDAALDPLCDFTVGEAIDVATLNVDVIVVSESGSADGRISGFTQLGCSWEDYVLMFPDTPSEPQALAPLETQLLLAVSEDPQFVQDVVVNGEWIPIFTVDPTETIDHQDLCIEECVNEGPMSGGPASIMSWSGPRLGGASSIEVLTVFPIEPDTQATKDRCNGNTMTQATEFMESQLGVTLNLVCYISITADARWNTADSQGFHQNDIDGNIFDSCRSYVDGKFSASVDGVNEIVYCWVKEGTPNGVASGDMATSAEKAVAPWPDHPNVPLAIHELGHIFGADHFPDDGWRKFACGSYHLHWWGWHYHSHKSVMNYCWMGWGHKIFDGTNFALIDDHIDDP